MKEGKEGKTPFVLEIKRIDFHVKAKYQGIFGIRKHAVEPERMAEGEYLISICLDPRTEGNIVVKEASTAITSDDVRTFQALEELKQALMDRLPALLEYASVSGKTNLNVGAKEKSTVGSGAVEG